MFSNREISPPEFQKKFKFSLNETVKMEKATFASGCFWSPQLAFSGLEGVSETKAGYMGGDDRYSRYEDAGRAGHAEVVQITFDPSKISYQNLLQVYWGQVKDPTALNRDGPNKGTQYRSVIFWHSQEQKELAEKSMKETQKKHGKEIATKAEPAGMFHEAEEYHQNYLKKRGINSCG